MIISTAQAWGGTFINSFLLSTPPPQLLDLTTFTQFVSIYLAVNNPRVAAFHPTQATLDTIVPVLDALCRTFPIAAAVGLASNHTNPMIRGSLLYQFILGGFAAAGGGTLVRTFNMFSADWKLSTPPILYSGLVGSVDFLAGAVAAGVYGFLSLSHPVYVDMANTLARLPHVSDPNVIEKGTWEASTPLMSPLGAKSVVVLVLAIIYATKAYVLNESPTVKMMRAKKQRLAAEAAAASAGKNKSGKVQETNKAETKKDL